MQNALFFLNTYVLCFYQWFTHSAFYFLNIGFGTTLMTVSELHVLCNMVQVTYGYSLFAWRETSSLDRHKDSSYSGLLRRYAPRNDDRRATRSLQYGTSYLLLFAFRMTVDNRVYLYCSLIRPCQFVVCFMLSNATLFVILRWEASYLVRLSSCYMRWKENRRLITGRRFFKNSPFSMKRWHKKEQWSGKVHCSILCT